MADGRVVWIFGGSSGARQRGDGRARPPWDGVSSTCPTAPTRHSLARSASPVSQGGSCSRARAAHRRRERARARRYRLCRARRRASCQAARAGRVVAAGRSAEGLERASEVGADATLRLDEADDLVAAFKKAFGGDGPSYVFDPQASPRAPRSRLPCRGRRSSTLGSPPAPPASSLRRPCASRRSRSSATTWPILRRVHGRVPTRLRMRSPGTSGSTWSAKATRGRRRSVASSGGRRRDEARGRSLEREESSLEPGLRRHVEDDEEQNQDVDARHEQDVLDQPLSVRIRGAPLLDRLRELSAVGRM